MAESDEWEFVEEWYGNPPYEILEGIKRRAKKHIAGVEETINSLDAVVRACQDWERNVLLSLCPECRNKHKRKKNKIKPEKMYQTHDDKRQLPSFLSFLRIGSGKKKSETMDKHSSSVDKTGQQSPEEMERSINALQLQLEAKEIAYIKSNQTKESENENLKKDNEKLKKENELIQLKLSSVVKDLEQTKKDRVCDVAKMKAEMLARSEEGEVTQKGLIEEISDLTKQLEKQKKQIGELDTKDEALRILKEELAEAKRPQLRDIVLGLRTERSGMGKTMIEMVNRELSGQLQSLMDKDNVRLTVKQCTTATDVQKGLLAVLCLDMSRVGTNIKDALAGIKVNRDVIVIVFHHTSRENLSSLTPTSLRITGSELRQLGAIIDMVFSSDGGIYECDLNSAAVANIASLLTKYS